MSPGSPGSPRDASVHDTEVPPTSTSVTTNDASSTTTSAAAPTCSRPSAAPRAPSAAAGAEVIADGHIHVYAPLRGKAIAGARGNTEARIFALTLEAELLSIAGIYRPSENPLPPEFSGQPTQVRLVTGPDGEKMVMNVMR